MNPATIAVLAAALVVVMAYGAVLVLTVAKADRRIVNHDRGPV